MYVIIVTLAIIPLQHFLWDFKYLYLKQREISNLHSRPFGEIPEEVLEDHSSEPDVDSGSMMNILDDEQERHSLTDSHTNGIAVSVDSESVVAAGLMNQCRVERSKTREEIELELLLEVQCNPLVSDKEPPESLQNLLEKDVDIAEGRWVMLFASISQFSSLHMHHIFPHQY